MLLIIAKIVTLLLGETLVAAFGRSETAGVREYSVE
jgi:hypothetical protein